MKIKAKVVAIFVCKWLIATNENFFTSELYSIFTKECVIYNLYSHGNFPLRFGRLETSDCWSSSILELWEFNRTAIEDLTVDMIIADINDTAKR